MATTTITKDQLAANIKAVTVLQGMTPADIARKSGIKLSNLYPRLAGTTKISAEDLDKIAGALEVSAAVLLSRPDTLLERLSVWVGATAGHRAA